MEKQYLVAEVLEKNRLCHRCKDEFQLGSIKIGKFENRRWNHFHPGCFWAHPPNKQLKPQEMMCYGSLSGDQQQEIDTLHKKFINTE